VRDERNNYQIETLPTPVKACKARGECTARAIFSMSAFPRMVILAQLFLFCSLWLKFATGLIKDSTSSETTLANFLDSESSNLIFCYRSLQEENFWEPFRGQSACPCREEYSYVSPSFDNRTLLVR
jgi:hypothetical protein